MPELPEINLPTPGKGLLAIAWAITVTAFIILLIDYKIKQEIVVSAKRVQADIESFERKYYARATGKADTSDGPSKPSGGDNSPSDSMVAGIAGMEKRVPLAYPSHGIGSVNPEAAREAQRAVNRTYAGTRGRIVAVPEEDRRVESEGDNSE